MSFFGRKEKKEIERLKSQMSPEQVRCSDLQGQIEEYEAELLKVQKAVEKEKAKLDSIKTQIIETDEAAMLQTFGFYTPHYAYTTSDEYKAKIADIRKEQKQLVKADQAIQGAREWTVNDSKSEGKKMINGMKTLFLRAFNAECDDCVEHVKFNNIESCYKKIEYSAESIAKLGKVMHLSITPQYKALKIQELELMHEYQVKKQEEKEVAKELRQQQREEARAARELEEARKSLEKEQHHYENALAKILKQLKDCKSGDMKAELESKRDEIRQQLSTISTEMDQVDYRAANQRAGYVYVISNIGAFGEGVYKIGMTRRLDPMDRVDELGDASVPFNFDVHAMIFTDDAPGLEAALHNAFADRKLNFVNPRREFFRVGLDEIKEVIRNNYDKTVEFVDIAPAEQYRESLLIKNGQNESN